MKAAILFTLGFLFPAMPVRGADPEPAAIDRLMNDALKQWDAPGAALVIVRDDRIVYLQGYGRKHIDKPEPVTPDTVFPLASCTKAFTSTLIATLVDEGEMRWDDPVRKHLPAFHLSDPNADAMVSMRDLLSHRTGVGTHDLLWYRAPWDTDELLKRVGKLPLEYPFRGGYAYSSIMYIAAGKAASDRAKEPWQTLVKARLTDPLGMKATYFTTTDVSAEVLASGHERKDGHVKFTPGLEFAEPNPAGSMHSSARDIAAWLRFQLSNGKTADGQRLVSERNLLETRSPQSIIPLAGANGEQNPDTTLMCYCMGWVKYDYRGKKITAHGGIVDGFRIQLTIVPEENLAFAVLSNLYEPRMTQAVSNALIDRFCGLSERDWNGFYLKFRDDADAAAKAAIEARDKARNPNRKPSLAVDGYAGTYENPAYGTAKVTAKDGKLELHWSSFRVPMEPFEGDAFRIPGGFFAEQFVEFAVKPGQGTTALRFAGMVFEKK